MGLASSQARLLSLTQRQHSVEHRAQYLQAQKLRLGMDSDAVYEKFVNALDSTKIQAKSFTADGKIMWTDANINNLMHTDTGYNNVQEVLFAQDINNGKVYIPEKFVRAYEASNDMYEFVENLGVIIEDRAAHYEEYENEFNSVNQNTYTKYNNQVLGEHYEDIYKAIQAAKGYIKISEEQAKNTSWLTNMIKSSQIILTKLNEEKDDLTNVAVSANVNVREVSNDKEIAKAEVEYETSLEEISDKETKITNQLNRLESERNAIETEIQSLKQVADDNIQATFKIFS